VNLKLGAGESIGIVGSNGAGKSTLLRVAAGIIQPSIGWSLTRGRVAPIIELGSGFDGELSGRENIVFNGALLGRSRRMLVERMDEIIDFSGLEGFIDAPLRTYSTGMVARLAFSIATAIEADLILLDEVLAVGDQAFTARCQERILGFYERGSAVMLVSHDLDAIELLCRQAVWLDHGVVRGAGATHEVVEAYKASLQLPA
jgi:ABC-type polysaccharide/polyol phosphate transport system ATPase subunit